MKRANYRGPAALLAALLASNPAWASLPSSTGPAPGEPVEPVSLVLVFPEDEDPGWSDLADPEQQTSGMPDWFPASNDGENEDLVRIVLILGIITTIVTLFVLLLSA